MEKLEFACLISRLQKALNVPIDSDISEQIYDIYGRTYENYGLFELYSEIRKKGTKITTDMMNWNKLVTVAGNLNIPQKHIKEAMVIPAWYVMRDRNDEMSITLVHPKFEIMKGDIIRMPDRFDYEINEIYFLDPDVYEADDEDVICENCRICLENIHTQEFIDIKTSQFISEITCKDVQYVESNWLNYLHK